MTLSDKFNTKKTTSLERFALALDDFALTLGMPAPGPATLVRAAENNQPTKKIAPARVSEGKKSMGIWENFVQSRRIKQAARATEKLELEDKLGNKIVISSKGDIEAYHNNTRVVWEPLLSDDHLTSIAKGDGIEVTAELLADFGRAVSSSKVNGRVTLAEWTPRLDTTVREEEIADKRKGSPEIGNETLLGSDAADEYKRINNPADKVREDLLGSPDAKEYKRGEHPDLAGSGKTREQMLEEDAGLYGRNFVDSDVKEHLLADARHGNPDEVIENQLDSVRKNYGPGAPNLVVKSAMDALGRAVVSSKVTPEEVVEAAAVLAANKDLAELIQLASIGNTHRRTIASRRDFHKGEAALLTPTAAILDELGKTVSKEITAADLCEIVCAAKSDTAQVVKSVTSAAKAIMNGSSLEPASLRKKANRTDLLRAAVASQTDEVNTINREHLKAVLMAFASAVEDVEACPEEIISKVASLDGDILTAHIELARSEDAVADRLTARARSEFFGGKRFASKQDIEENVIGQLADHAIEYNYPSSAIVEAAQLLTRNAKSAAEIITNLVEANKKNSQRTAAIQVTDEKTTTKRINCTVSDLGGLDPKSDDFEAQFRDRAIQILADSGFSVDPGSFAMNEVNVDASGGITASVTSRFSKTFNAEAGSSMSGQYNDATDSYPDEANGPAEPIGPNGTPQAPEGVEDSAVVSTASYKALKMQREAKRKEILSRYAQQGGMGGAGGGGQMPMAGGAEMGGADPAGIGAGADGMGLSALTAPTDASGNPMGAAAADDDSQPEPGTKKPLGSICPQCGGTNVDLANGQGHCNDCGAEITVSYNIEVKPASEEENKEAQGDTSEPADDMAPAGPELGGETGLGAATAPAPVGGPPAGPGAPPMGGTAASLNIPIMTRISWLADPDVWVQYAQEGFNTDTADRLPVGNICPSCGNRHAKKIKNTRYCSGCGEVYIPRIHEESPNPTKVLVSLDKIL